MDAAHAGVTGFRRFDWELGGVRLGPGCVGSGHTARWWGPDGTTKAVVPALAFIHVNLASARATEPPFILTLTGCKKI